MATLDIFISRASHLQHDDTDGNAEIEMKARAHTDVVVGTKPRRLKANFIDRKLQANIQSHVFNATMHTKGGESNAKVRLEGAVG